MNGQRVVFHIGLHKTGTTWLQKVLFPTLPGISVHRSRDFSKIDRMIDQRDPSRTLIVSHEGMSGSHSVRKQPGEREQRLLENIGQIKQTCPEACIAVGLREQSSWLNASFAEKAKKERVGPHEFVDGFSPSELMWCKILDAIDIAGVPAFCFLYEELVHDPQVLISDMCRFLGTAEPSNWRDITQRRANPSPRSAAGQAASRLFFQASWKLKVKRIPYFSRYLSRPLRGLGSRVGTKLDRFFPMSPVIALDEELERVLQSDWNALLRIAGERRNRDFSAFRIDRDAPAVR